MKTQSKKNKGRKLQQLMRRAILKCFPKLHEDDVASRSMGAAGEDVMLSSFAREYFPFSVECKSKASIAVYKFLEQANKQNEYMPLACVKANYKRPIVILYLDDFFKYVERLSSELYRKD